MITKIGQIFVEYAYVMVYTTKLYNIYSHRLATFTDDELKKLAEENKL